MTCITRITCLTGVLTLTLLGACRDTLTLTVYEAGSGAEQALGGVTVALDAADGTRVERSTGRDGVVALPVDWESGPHDVTLDGGEHGLRSYLGIDDGFDGGTHRFLETASCTTHPMSVTATHRTPDSLLYVMPLTQGGSGYEGHDHTFTISVPHDEPLSIVAHENRGVWQGDALWRDWLGWQLIDHAPVTAATHLDLDLRNTVEPNLATGHVDVLPGWLQPPNARAYAFVYLGSTDYTRACGWPSWTSPAPGGGGFDFELAWLAPAGAELVTVVEVFPHFGWWNLTAVSRVTRPGTPDTWDADPTMLPIPTIDTDGDWPSLYGEVVLEDVPDGTVPTIEITPHGGSLLWEAIGPEGMRGPFVFPDPPSSFDRARLDGRLDARPFLYRKYDDDWHDVATGESVWL